MSRRLPVYLVLDTSGSMSGEPIEAVRAGMNQLLADLRTDPTTVETAALSVITFNSSAQQVAPLTDLLLFNAPSLDAGGATALGEALTLLEQCIDREVNKQTPEKKGDWKPLVVLMTDGQPTDNWEAAADRIRSRRPANMIGCAAGSAADETMLKRFSEQVVKLTSVTPDAFKQFFDLISQSIKLSSARAAGPSPGADGSAPPLPPPQDPAVIQICP